MAFIDYISYEDASEELRKLYEAYGGGDKTPANIVRIACLNPAAMKAHVEFYVAVHKAKSPLSRQEREMIAVLVSGINQCHY